MALKRIRFISLLLTAVVTGIVVCHVLELPGKIALPGDVYLNVQQTLYHNWEVYVGIIEIGALLSTLLLSVLVYNRRGVFPLTITGLVCLVVMFFVLTAWIRPLDAQMDTWTIDTMPANWTQSRNEWEYLHATRAVFAVVGLSSLILAALNDTPTLRRGSSQKKDYASIS
jgi:hypothetical protein